MQLNWLEHWSQKPGVGGSIPPLPIRSGFCWVTLSPSLVGWDSVICSSIESEGLHPNGRAGSRFHSEKIVSGCTSPHCETPLTWLGRTKLNWSSTGNTWPGVWTLYAWTVSTLGVRIPPSVLGAPRFIRRRCFSPQFTPRTISRGASTIHLSTPLFPP